MNPMNKSDVFNGRIGGVMDEWYPRECTFCTREAALACADPVCRKRGYGEPHRPDCPADQSRRTEDCVCVIEYRTGAPWR